jgi:Rps23 Pro-64 3,4-dihydroxylase Tpa1-like proline 4-hydroxylase
MQEAEEEAARFRTRVAPHRVYADFLPPAEHAALLAWALAEGDRFIPSKVRSGRADAKVRRSLSLRDLGSAGSDLKTRLTALVPHMLADLRMAPFDVSRIELELISHGDGDYFRRHIDTMAGEFGADRAISAIYYFHRAPKGYSGGELRLYGFLGGDDAPFVDIEPAQNSLLVFPAWAPHEVRPIVCASGERADARFSVNCWLYRRREASPAAPARNG